LVTTLVSAAVSQSNDEHPMLEPVPAGAAWALSARTLVG